MRERLRCPACRRRRGLADTRSPSSPSTTTRGRRGTHPDRARFRPHRAASVQARPDVGAGRRQNPAELRVSADGRPRHRDDLRAGNRERGPGRIGSTGRAAARTGVAPHPPAGGGRPQLGSRPLTEPLSSAAPARPPGAGWTTSPRRATLPGVSSRGSTGLLTESVDDSRGDGAVLPAASSASTRRRPPSSAPFGLIRSRTAADPTGASDHPQHRTAAPGGLGPRRP